MATDIKQQSTPTRFVLASHLKTYSPPIVLDRLIPPNAASSAWGCVLGGVVAVDSRLRHGVWLRCYTTEHGIRLFLPMVGSSKTRSEQPRREGWEQFLRIAGGTGVALLDATKGNPMEASHAEAGHYAMMLTLGEYARRTKAYQTRHFVTRKDLVYSQCGEHGVLPDGFGDPTGRNGWSVDRLLDAGRDMLDQTPLEEPPKTQKMIAGGLWAGASAAPWPMPETAKKRTLALRRSLFINAGEAQPEAVEEAYTELLRLHQGRGRSRESESLGDYRAWHSGKSTNLPRLIVKALRKKWSEDTVRHAIADLCWYSLWYTAAAVSAAMTGWLGAACQALQGQNQPLLSKQEDLIFRLLYVGVPETCHYPLAVLFQRLDVLEPWIAAIATKTDAVPNYAVLYTLLGTYSLMADTRREVDRKRKRKRECSYEED